MLERPRPQRSSALDVRDAKRAFVHLRARKVRVSLQGDNTGALLARPRERDERKARIVMQLDAKLHEKYKMLQLLKEQLSQAASDLCVRTTTHHTPDPFSSSRNVGYAFTRLFESLSVLATISQ